EKAPLIISLHTWVGDYKEFDPLSDKALEANWNYIHPDFRGPNWTNDACLSENAISDIDDAISYALEKGNVDLDNIFVVGVSGGGYATLGTYIKTKYKINTFISWVPISDLGLWYKQNRDRGNKYANDIISCTSSNGVFDRKLTDLRSPLQWELPESQGNIEIYAGIDDGHSGPVPVSHSILFFNKLAAMHDHNNVITTEESILLIDRLLPLPDKINTLDGRDILFEKHAGPAS
ncbi:alpha/beta hydrolase family protein, partial [Vibrio sp. 10N.222.55.E8]